MPRLGRRRSFDVIGGKLLATALALSTALAGEVAAQGTFTLQQMLSYPYPQALVAAPAGTRIAWVVDRQGLRNVWAAEGPDFKARQVTSYRADDGQELTNLAISRDGKTIVYVRGGDHDANWPAEGGVQPNPASSPKQPKMQIWTVPFGGGTPKLLADGDEPAISPRGDRVAFLANEQISIIPLDGSKPATQVFARGTSGSLAWSPSGDRLAFVSDRGDHSFVGVYSADTAPIRFLSPGTARDGLPQWSPDGKRVAFVRLPGEGGAPGPLLSEQPEPWAIYVSDATSGVGREIWKSPSTLLGSVPSTDGGPNLHWGANGRITFLVDLDGWPHLYSVPETGGEPLLLTPGNFMAEHIKLSPDGAFLVYAANSGPAPEDQDRRHVFKVPVDRAEPVLLTPGDGVEWTPVVTGDSRVVAFIGSGVRAPPQAAVVPVAGGKMQLLGESTIPSDFPTTQMVVPRSVSFKAADGIEVHGQLFTPLESGGKRAALVFVHGGPPRQMLLGWHYMDYYSNGYAMNQYMASRGYVVLALNYRLGIGYGHAFHHPEHAGPWGASEYNDVKAAGDYLRTLPSVDPKRIGIWGGSYGGFLTALALARNSDLFVAGVDLHGVHDWVADIKGTFADLSARHEKGDVKEAEDVAWKSSPVSSIATWKSPVLLIQGDDDRNVRFHQTVDLERRLTAAGVPHEELVLPDEIHGFLRHASWMTADSAVASYFERVLPPK